MSSFKTIVFGALVWVVAFVVVSAFIGFGADAESASVGITTLAAVLIATVLLAKKLKLRSTREALITGLIWLVTIVVLDAIISARFTGWEIFYRWNVIIGYLLVLVIPALVAEKPKK